MCTLMLAWRATPRTRLAVSANRNEFIDRPATGPRVVPGDPTIWAPRDEKEGGTWLGVNARGLFVCLTNRRHATVDAARTSRGQLVREALAAGSASALRAQLEFLPGDRHNGFHLAWADPHEAWLAIGDGKTVRLVSLAPGIHLVTERSFGAGEGLREAVALESFTRMFERGEPSLDDLREPMLAHGPREEPLESACVHAEIFGYGTRSSLQLIVPVGGRVRAAWTEGQPCREQWRDVSDEVAPLFR